MPPKKKRTRRATNRKTEKVVRTIDDLARDLEEARAAMHERAVNAHKVIPAEFSNPSPAPGGADAAIALYAASAAVGSYSKDASLSWEERAELRAAALLVGRLARAVADAGPLRTLVPPLSPNVGWLIRYARDRITPTKQPGRHLALTRDERTRHEEDRTLASVEHQRANPTTTPGAERERLVCAIAGMIGAPDCAASVVLPRRFGARIAIAASVPHHETGKGGGCRCTECEARVIVTAVLRAARLGERAAYERTKAAVRPRAR